MTDDELMPRIVHRTLAAEDMIVIRRATLSGYMAEIVRQGGRQSVAFSNIQDLTSWLAAELGDELQAKGWFRRGQR